MKDALLFDIHGIRHAVWAGPVREIREAGTVMRLPMSPDFMAGLTVVDGRTTVLADLGACLGLPPVSRKSPVQTLLVCGGDDDSGFLVEGEVRRVSLDADARSLSGFLRHPLLDGFFILDGRPVPVFDLTALIARLRADDGAPPAPELSLPAVRVRQFSRMHNFRLFTLSSETFAAPAAVLHKQAATGQVTPLGGLPPFVAGIAAAGDGIVPVLRLQTLLGLAAGDGDGTLLLAGESGAEFGLAVQADGGEIRGKAASLPPLVRSPGLTHALLDAEGIIPLLEPATLIAGESCEPPLPERYAPDLDRLPLGREDFQVLEFNILGTRYALPRSRVEDILPVPVWRPIPGSSPLAPGVTEYNGELWPVLDLALYLGRTTCLGPGAQVIAVRDGDFKALVMAEEVLGERCVPVESHRDLPFAIPHNLVFGCYVDADMVILVLNVPALAVRFDPELVSLFQGTLPTKDRHPVAAPEEIGEVEQPSAGFETGPFPPPPFPGAEPPTASDEETHPEAVPSAAVDPVEGAVPEALAPRLPEEIEEIVDPAETAEEPESPETASAAEDEETPAPFYFGVAEEKPPSPLPEEPVSEVIREAPAAEVIREEPLSEALREEPAAEEIETAESPAPEMEEPVEFPLETRAAGEEEEAPEAVSIVIDLVDRRPAIPSAAAPREDGTEEPVCGQNVPQMSSPFDLPDDWPPDADRSPGELPSVGQRKEASPRRRRVNPILFMFLPLLLAGVLWPWLSPEKSDEEAAVPSVSIAGPTLRPEPVVETQQMTAPEAAAPQLSDAGTTETAVAKPSLPEPSTAAAPPALPPPAPAAVPAPPSPSSPPSLYQIRRGDTLWDIAGRFTGDPFNYSPIARDNKIHNPDRIYPGQQIAISNGIKIGSVADRRQ